ncbi:MAG TPA: hypothetical protein VEZ14_08015 [Dehalococcoidia bacterium]|nr:hypothetical protein [Dehalococcoidia bacterium]
MLALEARTLARRWVEEHAAARRGFAGAYFAGSITTLADDAELPRTSDVDVWVVLAGESAPGKLGKFAYRGLTLDVTCRSLDRLRPPEAILADYHVAPAFRTPNIIADPSGELTELQAAVSSDFAGHPWVTKRCDHARSHALSYLRMLKESDDFHDQVIAWLFANGVLTHVLLVAGLRNPTVRRRYAAVRELLAAYGRLDFHADLLESLGCARMSPAHVEHHLAALSEAFDDAAAVADAPFPFTTDITPVARPIAIDGSRELIEACLHREAIFWIAVTSARCQKTLHHGATPEVAARHESGFRDLLADLGIASATDLRREAHGVETLLPSVWAVAEAVTAANPEITGEPGN